MVAQQLLEKSLSKGTRKQYEKALQRCLSFLRDCLGVGDTLPMSENHLHLYIADMHSNNYKHATILTHISAISHYHKINNLPDPTATYSTSKILTGVRNLQDNLPDARRPITRQILKGLIVAIRACSADRYQYYLYKSLYTLMYYACLRASEVISTESPEHIVQMSQVSFLTDNKSFYLSFTSYKHCSDSSFKLIVTTTSTPDCPVKNMENYLAVRGTQPGPLYHIAGVPLTRHQFSNTLNHCLKYLKLDPSHFNTHSFRIGRTTDMAAANVPHTTIKHIGRWKSNAFMKYVRPTITTMP